MTNSGIYFEEMLSEQEAKKLPYLETIPLLLEKCHKDYKDHPALCDDTRFLSYGELYENVKRRISLLNELDITKDAHVALLCRNTVDAMCWLLAIPSSGRVLVMLPSLIDVSTLNNLVKKFDISAIVAEECFIPQTISLTLPVIPASECGSDTADFEKVGKETTAAIYLTGGTTGEPKGAMLSHGALLRGAKNGTYRPSGEVFDNTTILLLPLSHIFGTVAGFLSCLYTGSTIYGCKDVKSGIMMIPQVKPTLLVLVPGMIELILNITKLKGERFLGNLRCIMAGGAPISPKLARELKKYNIRLYPGYGMTEGANLTSASIDLDTRPHSMGKIYPNQEVKVVSNELWIRGDNVMQGYYNAPEATAEVLTPDGWLKTGDLVSFDDDGFITILGRKDNLIILPNGENICPEEHEDTFNTSDLIKDCLVKEERIDSKPVLTIEILPMSDILCNNTPEELSHIIHEEVKRINNTLPSFKQITNIVIRTEDFKRTGALKIDRKNQS